MKRLKYRNIENNNAAVIYSGFFLRKGFGGSFHQRNIISTFLAPAKSDVELKMCCTNRHDTKYWWWIRVSEFEVREILLMRAHFSIIFRTFARDARLGEWRAGNCQYFISYNKMNGKVYSIFFLWLLESTGCRSHTHVRCVHGKVIVGNRASVFHAIQMDETNIICKLSAVTIIITCLLSAYRWREQEHVLFRCAVLGK